MVICRSRKYLVVKLTFCVVQYCEFEQYRIPLVPLDTLGQRNVY